MLKMNLPSNTGAPLAAATRKPVLAVGSAAHSLHLHSPLTLPTLYTQTKDDLSRFSRASHTSTKSVRAWTESYGRGFFKHSKPALKLGVLADWKAEAKLFYDAAPSRIQQTLMDIASMAGGNVVERDGKKGVRLPGSAKWMLEALVRDGKADTLRSKVVAEAVVAMEGVETAAAPAVVDVNLRIRARAEAVARKHNEANWAKQYVHSPQSQRAARGSALAGAKFLLLVGLLAGVDRPVVTGLVAVARAAQGARYPHVHPRGNPISTDVHSIRHERENPPTGTRTPTSSEICQPSEERSLSLSVETSAASTASPPVVSIRTPPLTPTPSLVSSPTPKTSSSVPTIIVTPSSPSFHPRSLPWRVNTSPTDSSTNSSSSTHLHPPTPTEAKRLHHANLAKEVHLERIEAERRERSRRSPAPSPEPEVLRQRWAPYPLRRPREKMGTIPYSTVPTWQRTGCGSVESPSRRVQGFAKSNGGERRPFKVWRGMRLVWFGGGRSTWRGG